MATVYAIFVFPASVISMLGVTKSFPRLSSAMFHAHEMLFGFALVAVAGNQLGPTPMPASLPLSTPYSSLQCYFSLC